VRLGFVSLALLAGCSLVTDLADLGGANDAAVDAAEAAADVAEIDANDAGPSDCPPGAFFCDDFESEQSVTPKWDVESFTAPNAIGISTDHAHSGTHSLHIAVNDDGGTNPSAFLTLTKALGTTFAAGSTFAMRAFVYAPVAQSAESWFTLSRQSSGGNITFTNHVDPAHCASATEPCLLAYRANDGNWEIASSVNFNDTLSQWVCVEWVMSIGDAGAVAAYLATSPYTTSAPLFSTTENDVLTGGAFDSLSVGYEYADGPQEMYVDDVVVAPSRVGCL
jgi:hypothetical protein